MNWLSSGAKFNFEWNFSSSQSPQLFTLRKSWKSFESFLFAQFIPSAVVRNSSGTSVTMRCQAINPFSGISLSKNRQYYWSWNCVIVKSFNFSYSWSFVWHWVKSFYPFCMYTHAAVLSGLLLSPLLLKNFNKLSDIIKNESWTTFWSFGVFQTFYNSANNDAATSSFHLCVVRSWDVRKSDRLHIKKYLFD